MRLFNRLTAATAALAPLLLVTPAQATHVLAGEAVVVFEGDVTLPVFPCTPSCGATGTPATTPPTPGQDYPNNPLVFVADVALGEIATVGPEGAGIIDRLVARVFYSEPACVAGEALTGAAFGTATLSGTNVVGTPLPATVPFQWTRVGLVAVITPYIPPNKPAGPQINTHPAVVGAAVFVPTGGAPNCTGGPLTATVLGAATAIWI